MIKIKRDREMDTVIDKKSVSQPLKIEEILVTEEQATFQLFYHLLYQQSETTYEFAIGLKLTRNTG